MRLCRDAGLSVGDNGSWFRRTLQVEVRLIYKDRAEDQKLLKAMGPGCVNQKDWVSCLGHLAFTKRKLPRDPG